MRFPKPQVVVYTLLMVPVMYGASKLIASPGSSSGDWSAGVAALVLIPLPILAYWAYVLITWRLALHAAVHGNVQRSRSSILRAYGSGINASTTGLPASDPRRPSGSQHGAATLALWGDARENPTLIIRDKKPGEEDFEHFFDGDGDSDSSDDSGLISSHHGGGGGPQPVVATGSRPSRPQGGLQMGGGRGTAAAGASGA